jgi:hypothetical protein
MRPQCAGMILVRDRYPPRGFQQSQQRAKAAALLSVFAEDSGRWLLEDEHLT